MSPVISKEDIVIWVSLKNSEPEDGSYVVLSNKGKIVIRRVAAEDGNTVFVPENEGYEKYEHGTDDCKLIGVVTEVYSRKPLKRQK
jgi:SOS-response transcriptional repressor LexA